MLGASKEKENEEKLTKSNSICSILYIKYQNINMGLVLSNKKT